MRTDHLIVKGIEDLERATGRNREFHPVQMGRRKVTGRLACSEFGGLTLTHGQFYSDIHVSGTFSNDQLTLAVLLKAKDVCCFGKEAAPGDVVVVDKGQETDGRYRSEIEYVVINVGKPDMIRLAETEDLVIPPGMLDGCDLYKLEDGQAARLAQRMISVSEKLRNGSLQAIGPLAEQALADEIVLEHMCSLPGASSKGSIRDRPHQSLPRLVRRAEDWLAANQGRQPRVSELSAHLRVSPRQLYRAFHAELSMSPAKYLRRYRLTQARLELLAADPAVATVTRVAHSWGFWDLGRFAGEFRRMFGECPSQTLTRSEKRHSGATRF